LDSAQPADHWVPTDAVLVHQTFIPALNRPQVAEGRCGYGGSNKAVSVERDSVWKEQLLEPLALLERRLHPQVGGARQNAFCERQDAFHVEFFELV
jgi:hypothetical protein